MGLAEASARDTYNKWIAAEAHSLGLAAFQKNDLEQVRQLQPYSDGTLDEQCGQYFGVQLAAVGSRGGQAGTQRRAQIGAVSGLLHAGQEERDGRGYSRTTQK
ncbi:MAG: endo alpha-1,4 polygalactosaminidase [Solirubrobacteraceae bacterium]